MERKLFRGAATKQRMSLSGNLRRRGASCANRPNWLVGKQDVGKLLRRERARAAGKLPRENFLCKAGITLLLRFSQAHNGSQAARERHEALLCNVLIGLPEQLAAFGVSDDDTA